MDSAAQWRPKDLLVLTNSLQTWQHYHKMESTCLSVCRHLPNRGKDKLWARSVQEEKYRHTPAGGRSRGKKHKCKYFKRSLPLHHCWLCLILWASTNSGRWIFFPFLSQPKKKKWKSRKNTVVSVSLLCHVKVCMMPPHVHNLSQCISVYQPEALMNPF